LLIEQLEKEKHIPVIECPLSSEKDKWNQLFEDAANSCLLVKGAANVLNFPVDFLLKEVMPSKETCILNKIKSQSPEQFIDDYPLTRSFEVVDEEVSAQKLFAITSKYNPEDKVVFFGDGLTIPYESSYKLEPFLPFPMKQGNNALGLAQPVAGISIPFIYTKNPLAG